MIWIYNCRLAPHVDQLRIVESQTPWIVCRKYVPGWGVNMYLYIYIRFKWDRHVTTVGFDLFEEVKT